MHILTIYTVPFSKQIDILCLRLLIIYFYGLAQSKIRFSLE